MALSVRENATLSSLPRYASNGVVSRRAEVAAVRREVDALQIRTASLETDVEALSGGNQQKVVLARAMLSAAQADPRRRADPGRRRRRPRRRSTGSCARSPSPACRCSIVSSDGLELEGLCDRVVVFSRGRGRRRAARRGRLGGEDRADDRHRHHAPGGRRRAAPRRAAARLSARGASSPATTCPASCWRWSSWRSGVYTYGQNPRFTATFNVTSLLTLLAALAFISFGQLIVIMTAGIDISVGPAGGPGGRDRLVLPGRRASRRRSSSSASPSCSPLRSPPASINGLMVRVGRFTAVAATLVTYIGLQGISLLLRPFQGGFISADDHRRHPADHRADPGRLPRRRRARAGPRVLPALHPLGPGAARRRLARAGGPPARACASTAPSSAPTSPARR